MVGNVFEIYKTGTGFNSILTPAANWYAPSQLPEEGTKDFTEQWYLDNLRYIISFYNTPTDNVNNPVPENTLATSPVSRMIRNLDYVIGEQNWGAFNYIVNETQNSQYYFRKNRKIATIVDKMLGAAHERMSRMVIGADPLSPEAKTRKDDRVNAELFKYLIRPIIKDNPAFKLASSEDDFQSTEAIKTWGEMGLKDHLADVFISIGEHELQSKRIKDKGELCALHAISTGLAAMESVVDNGRPMLLWHPSYNIILDNRRDQRYGEEARFVGAVDNMTLTHLYEKYSFLTTAQREELNRIAMTPNLLNQLNVIVPNITWWTSNPTTPPTYKDAAVSVVRCYWISPDNEDPTTNALYMAEIIGNKYMVNYGKCNNVVTQLYETYKPMLPIHTWTPGMIKGNLNALLSRITDLCDEYELYRAKIRQLVHRTKGQVFIEMGSALGKNDSVKDIMDDFTDLGIHVFTDTADNVVDKREKMQMRNITNEAAIESLIKLNQLVDEEINSFVGQSKISMGEQTKYVGSAAFSGSLEQSALGSSWIYDGLMNYLSIVLRYQVNLTKNLYADGQLSWEASHVIGDDGIKLLNTTKDKFAEHYLIFITLKDTISDGRREALDKLAMQAVQQPQILPYIKDLVKMMNAKTTSGMIDDLEDMATRIEKQQSEQAEANQKFEAAKQASEQASSKEELNSQLAVKKIKNDKDDEIKRLKLELEQEKLNVKKAELGMTI